MFNPTITFAISPVSQQYLPQIFWANAMHKRKLIKAQTRLRNSSNDVRRNEKKKSLIQSRSGSVSIGLQDFRFLPTIEKFPSKTWEP